MKNLLNNPWVVGALCLVALITVYFRLFDKPSRPEPSATVAQTPSASNVTMESSPAPPLQIAETVPSSDPPQDSAIDVGWPEKFIRDPFQAIRTTSLLSDREEDQENLQEPDQRREEMENILRLQAVFLEGQTRVAMINRRLVKEGEQVNGYVVDRIDRESVRLTGKEDARVLEFVNSQKEPSPTS